MRKFLLIVLSLCFCGCATSVDMYLKSHPETSFYSKDCMMQQKLCLGMTMEEVEATFGAPANNYFDSIEGDNLYVYVLSTPDSGTSLSLPERYCLRFVGNALTRIETGAEEVERERQERVGQYIQEHTERSDFKQVMLDKKIQMGMSEDEVKMSWGEPTSINTTVNEGGKSEQWVYGSYEYSSKLSYVYFENGILSSWQN